MSKTFIRTAYNDPYVDTGVKFVDIDGVPEKSLTVQSEVEECDINVIVDRYTKSGLLPVMNQSPVYGDVTDAASYQEAMNIVIEAEKAFNSLPAKYRKEFENNPAQFLDFMNNPENEEKMREWGLLPQIEAPEPSPAPAGGTKTEA